MTKPDPGNVVITFNPKWVAGLIAFMADPDDERPLARGFDIDLYGIQFHADGPSKGVIVAGSRSAMAIVRDPETAFIGHDGRPVVVHFSGDFAKACRAPKVNIVDVNGDRMTFAGAPWATPKQILVTAFGLNQPKHVQQITWRVHPQADPPGVSREKAEDMGWSLAAGTADARWAELQPFPWQKALEPVLPITIDHIFVQPKFLANLRHFGSAVRMTFHEDRRIIATFPEAPEVTAIIMPLR